VLTANIAYIRVIRHERILQILFWTKRVSKKTRYIWKKAGINLPPSQFEAMFVSLAHTEEDIEKTIQANRYSLEVLKEA